MLLAASLAVFLLASVWPASNKITDGFAAYYTASRAVLEGRADPVLYDDNLFRLDVEQDTAGQASDIYWANPPTTALLFLPIASFPPEVARRLWIGFNLFALILAIYLLIVALQPPALYPGRLYIGVSIFLLSVPLADNFDHGQAYIFILCLMCLALFALQRRLDWLAGLCLALAILFKASGIPLWILLALHGRWRLIVWSGLIFMMLTLATLPLLGVHLWQTFLFEVAPRFLRDPVISVSVYQTIPGLLRHIFTYDPTWNPLPLANWPLVALLTVPLISCLLVGIAGYAARRSSLTWTFVVGLLLSVILVPSAEGHQYVLLLPAFLFALYGARTPGWPLWIAAALIALPLPFAQSALSQGWLALLAYPRLYGALILFAILQPTDRERRVTESGLA